MTTDGPADRSKQADEQQDDAREVALGQELANPGQITEAAGDAPDSSGPHGADAVGSARPPRPEDLELGGGAQG
jgi:hypothetical protein